MNELPDKVWLRPISQYNDVDVNFDEPLKLDTYPDAEPYVPEQRALDAEAKLRERCVCDGFSEDGTICASPCKLHGEMSARIETDSKLITELEVERDSLKAELDELRNILTAVSEQGGPSGRYVEHSLKLLAGFERDDRAMARGPQETAGE